MHSMLIYMCTVAQFAEILSCGVHLSTRFIVRKERAYIPILRHKAAHGHVQEPTPVSTALFGLKTLSQTTGQN